jgi:sRNA-binding protein
MEAVWGAVLAFLFILATLPGYNVTGPWTSEQKEQLEKQLKEQKEDFEKKQKEEKEEVEKQQKEKSEKSDKKQKSGKPDKGSSSAASNKKSSFFIRDCPDDFVTDVLAGAPYLRCRSNLPA